MSVPKKLTPTCVLMLLYVRSEPFCGWAEIAEFFGPGSTISLCLNTITDNLRYLRNNKLVDEQVTSGRAYRYTVSDKGEELLDDWLKLIGE